VPERGIAMRHSGIDPIGDVPWGTHFCQFYETGQDLIETLVPYFKAGLTANEFCVWLTSEPLKTNAAKAALKAAVPGLPAYIRKGQIEFIDGSQWYARAGRLAADEVLKGWGDKLETALSKGYEGLRLAVTTLCLENDGWQDIHSYEAAIGRTIGRREILAACCYALGKRSATEIIDAAAHHDFTIIKRAGQWEIIESSAHRQAVETLRKERDFSSTVLETAGALVVVLDRDGRIMRFNRMCQTVTGYSETEVLGRVFWEFLVPDEDLPGVRQAWEALWAGNFPNQHENGWVAKDGTRRLISWSNSAIAGPRGEIEYVIGTGIDITKRRRTEEALRESEEKYRHLVKHAPAGIYEMDFRAQRFTSVNDAMCEMSGYSREELLAMNPLDILDKPSRQLFQQRIRKWLAGEKPDDSVEYRVQSKDGRQIYALLNVRFTSDEIGKPSGAAVIAYDITERKKSEDELRRTREHLENLIDYANAPIIVWDSEFKISRFNHAFERLTGHRANKVLGLPLDILFPEATREESLAHIKRTLAGERWEVVEIPIRRTDGSIRAVLWNSANVYDRDGAAITATIAQGQDITDRKRAEEELRRLNRTLTALSHSGQALMRARNEEEFLEEACQIIVKDCGHAMVWIGYAEHDEEKTVRPVAYAGFEEGYLETLKITWADTERGRGPTGVAIRTGKPCTCTDMLTDPKFAPWREEAIARGYASSLVLPLQSEGRAFGAISIYFKQPGAVPEEELNLLTELANDVACGIASIRLREAHARAEEALRESEERLAAFAAATFEGVVLTREGVIVDCNEQFAGMAGQSLLDLRGTPIERLIAPEDRVRVMENIRNGRESVVEFQMVRPDGSRLTVEVHGRPSGGLRYSAVRDITDRKKAEQALLEALAQAEEGRSTLQALLAHVPEGITIADASLNIRMVSRYGEEVLGGKHDGISVEEVARQWRVFHEDGKAEMAADDLPLARAILKGEVVKNFELVQMNAQGKRLPLLCNASPIRDSAGNILGGVVAWRDVTEIRQAQDALLQRTQELQQLTGTLEQRVRARTAELAEANELLQAEVTHSYFMEDELRQQKEALQTVIDNIPVMLCFYDSEGKAKLTNREFERLLGWSKEEAETLDIAPSRTRGTASGPTTSTSAAQGIPGWQEYKLRTRSGDDLDSSWAGVQLSDGGRIGIGIDMRERRAAEEERLRLAAAVEQSKEGTAITDSKGIIGYVNPAFEQTSGAARAELIGRCYYDVLAWEEADEGPGKDVRETAERGEAWSGHVIRKKKNGQSSELDISVTPIRDESRRIINYLIVERDVTQEVRLQEHLRHVQNMEALGTLAGGIAHDFNNILNPIFINTELILMDATLDEETRRDLEITLKAAERGRDLVKQIITFSRQKEKERKPSKVGPVIKEALRFLRSSVPATIDIRQNIQRETGFILVDPTQIHQVVMNLVNNAAYSMREGGGVLEVSLGEVEVDSDLALLHPDLKPGPYLRLTVSDTGTGMTRDVMERAFDPFFTTKKHAEGSGMGLAVVHGIVRDYNGAITVYSEVGKGTTFNIFFPRVPADEVRSEAAVESLPKGMGRILLVDDEDAQVQSIRSMLKRLGYHVVAKTDPEEALKAVLKDPAHFDLVITDQIMPRLTGDQLAERILRARPGLPIILCTGFSEKVDANGAHDMGVCEFLMKPFSIREMAAAINRALKKG
jgi:PAS domain S-box-containing protein